MRLLSLALAVQLTRAWETGDALYFYKHVPKTGGVSFSHDLVDKLGLVPCFGRESVKKTKSTDVYGVRHQDTLNKTLALERGHCTFGNTEGKYGEAAKIFPWKPRVLLLFRDPQAHFVSQYAHCQASNDIEKWGHERVSIEEWTSHWHHALHGRDATSRKKGYDAAMAGCHYNPINMQTRKLCDTYHKTLVRDKDASSCLSAVLNQVTRAWHVGHLEEYDRGLCVVNLRMKGGPLDGCACATPDRENLGRWNDHGIHAKDHHPDARTRSMIANITASDLVVWQAAKRRFRRDVEDLSGAVCSRAA